MQEIKIEKKYHFYAAHRNKEAGEKCGRIHGHTYDVTCYFEFNSIVNGLTMLFSDIDKIAEPIIKQYDHTFLLYDKDPLVKVLELNNEPFTELPFETSAENMSIWILTQIKNAGLPIVKIELAETKTSKVIYEVSSK
jgi:6-pyruvoyltetrahydropterin/6-carboxytetrahydropterin synthase